MASKQTREHENQTLILASMTLNLSKSLRDALLFWTISFLPHELFSHLFFTSAIRIGQLVNRTAWIQQIIEGRNS
jgi:hypothetical protein